jgi:hypothetical protein
VHTKKESIFGKVIPNIWLWLIRLDLRFPTKVGSSNRTNLRSLPQDPEAERKLLASADIPFSEQAQGSMNCLIENQYAINQSQGGTLSKTDIKGWYPKDDKILDVHGWDIYSNKTGATVHGLCSQ